MQQMLENLQAYAAEQYALQFCVDTVGFVCDLSYNGLQDAADVITAFKPNMPTWGVYYSLPLEELRAMDLPVFNIGPLGKDAHQFTERLNLPYSLYVTPKLLRFTVAQLLK